MTDPRLLEIQQNLNRHGYRDDKADKDVEWLLAELTAAEAERDKRREVTTAQIIKLMQLEEELVTLFNQLTAAREALRQIVDITNEDCKYGDSCVSERIWRCTEAALSASAVQTPEKP